jgi:hypothetical protein
MFFATACTKETASNQASDKGSTSANSNQPAQSAEAAPYAQANIKGDIERISLAISVARDSARSNKWQEAASQLRGAKREVDAALGRKPRLQDEFEALKVAIDRAIPLVENGAKEADAKISDLQTRIGAIKINSY